MLGNSVIMQVQQSVVEGSFNFARLKLVGDLLMIRFNMFTWKITLYLTTKSFRENIQRLSYTRIFERSIVCSILSDPRTPSFACLS